MKIIQLALVPLFLALSTSAQIVSISPFTGTLSETFEGMPTGFQSTPWQIMGGAASFASSTGSAIVGSPGVFGFGIGSNDDNTSNNSAQPSDGSKFLGIDQGGAASATGTITFTQTVSQFGAFFGNSDNGSGSPTGFTVKLFDTGNAQIGSDQIFNYSRPGKDGLLEWHGWQSSVPIQKVTFESNFPVADGFQATPVPEPKEWAVVAGVRLLSFAAVRRHRKIPQT